MAGKALYCRGILNTREGYPVPDIEDPNMTDPHAKPLTILALMQIAVILLGIVAAGVFSKIFVAAFRTHPPALMTFVRDRGFLLLGIPMLWLLMTLLIRHSESQAHRMGVVLYVIGIALIVALAFFMVAVTAGSLSQGHGGL
jgi:hypothetical protein